MAMEKQSNRRSAIEKMSIEELRDLTRHLRQRSNTLNEELRVLQEQIAENTHRISRFSRRNESSPD